jgi:hypothetical protein
MSKEGAKKGTTREAYEGKSGLFWVYPQKGALEGTTGETYEDTSG